MEQRDVLSNEKFLANGDSYVCIYIYIYINNIYIYTYIIKNIPTSK